MEYEEIKKKFIDFLVENKAYRQFMLNLAYCEEGMYSWDTYAYDVSAHDFITCAFVWNYSKEDHTFWEDLNEKWINILDKLDH